MSEEKTQIPEKWLIVALIYADFTDKTSNAEGDIFIGLEAMFGDILAANINSDLCRLFVLMDSISHHEKDGKKYIRNAIVLYEIAKSATNTFNEIKECKVLAENWEDAVIFSGNRHIFQNERSLADMLSFIEVASDEQILLLTWDHGAGFGIFNFKRMRIPPRASMETELILRGSLKYFWESAFTAVLCENHSCLAQQRSSQPSKKPEILENSELAGALKIWLQQFSGKKVDVLLMMNCWMMNLHTMYAMKDIVTCLVAPQSDIGNPGYNYSDIIKFINDPLKSRKPKDIAQCCVDSHDTPEFRLKVTNMGFDSGVKGLIDECVLLAVALHDENKTLDTHLAALNVFINQLHSLILNDISGDAVKYLLRYARTVSYDFTESEVYLIDINHFIVLLGLMNAQLFTPLISLEAACEQLRKNKGDHSIVIAGWGNNQKYCTEKTVDYVTPVPTGYGLFFRRGVKCPEAVNHLVSSDKLLNEYFRKWNDVLTLVIGDLRPNTE